jgi:hypothetical protein
MHLERFVQTEGGRLLMSVILGVGLATLFKVSCKDKNCLLMRAPPLEQLKDKIYKVDDKCYKFKPTQTKCSATTENFEFA